MHLNKHITGLLTVCWLLALPGCGGKDYITAPDGSAGPLVIYPDYKDVTIPANIAPLNFRYAMADVRKAKTTFTLGDRSVTLKGTKVEWRLGAWKTFLEGAEGQTISVTAEALVEGKPVTDSWSVYVSEDPVDGYLTYRLIEPSNRCTEWHIQERLGENTELHQDWSC